jgi:acyl transferase domain-containing protein/protein-L-isoaspartate O-methyltransferase
MSDTADLRRKILELPPKRLALLALELQEQLERERRARSEPIAVVGMACRFPGGSNSPDEFWQLLAEGRDAVVEVPADRWPIDELYDPDPDASGKIATRWGGYLDDVKRFDASFFSISPREARAMDPQQRILLETCWRAFEDAGIPPRRYYGEKAGVFIGICNNDYLVRLLKEGPEAIDLYLSSGNAYSVAAGRLSFTFGFQGPAIAVDTACSSSLVAIHSACQSLLSGESTLAIAGGVNVMCSAETSMALSRSHMMAPDGRCKTFDDAADGFVRAEGCGVLLLKRLSDAERDGDRIHAVLRGTALGQDGRSTGLTVPNGPAQEWVIREALAAAGLSPADVDYIEAHGTGTSLGDPLEIRALGNVFTGERQHPLCVGSVKTNVGHLESAAGVAGVIKAILAVQHGEIPPHLHFRTPSRHIDWDAIPLEVPHEGRAWPETGRPRRAGVSSFGFSGTNAHVIVEQAPSRTSSASAPPRAELIVASGATVSARDAIMGSYADALDAEAAPDLPDFCHTTRAGRAHLAHRRAVVAGDARELRAALAGAEGAPVVHDSRQRVADPPDVVFLFTGQGAQYPGMGRSLYQQAPAFRAAIDRCAAVLDPLMGMPLTEVLFSGEGDEAPIYRTALAQPSVAAFEYALAQQWIAWGIQPAAVLGHSLGEFVAATIAGVLTLEDMLRLVRERGRLLDSLPTGDRMAAVFAAPEALEDLFQEQSGRVEVAAYNGPANTVISGPADRVDAVVAACAARGIDHRVLRLARGFHSRSVEPMLDALESFALAIEHRAPTLPIAWNVTGTLGDATAPSGSYWRAHARGAVRFTQSVTALGAQGFRHFLEVGPHPTLTPLVGQALETEDPVLVPSLRRGSDAWRDMLEALGHLYVHGADVDWRAVDDGRSPRRIAIPGHPLEGDAYWVETSEQRRSTAPRGAIPGVRLATAVPIYETIFTPDAPSFLTDHRYHGRAVVPGPVFTEMALAAARAVERSPSGVSDFTVRRPAFVDEGGLRLQTLLEPTENGATRFRILSAAPDAANDARWSEHATGLLIEGDATPPVSAPEPGRWTPVAVNVHLARIRSLGFELGPAVVLYADLEVGERTARARLTAPAAKTPEAVGRALLIDAAIQVLGAAVASQGVLEPRMLTGVDRLIVRGDLLAARSCRACVRETRGGASVVGDVLVYDARNDIVAALEGVRLTRVASGDDAASRWYHCLEWRDAPSVAVPQATGFVMDDIARAAYRLRQEWAALADASGLAAYVGGLPALRQRVAGHIASALRTLRRTADSTDIIHVDALINEAHIDPTRRKLVARLLDILVESSLAERVAPGRIRLNGRALSDEHAPTSAIAHAVDTLVDRCGRALAEVLRGDLDPLTLLFPAGAEDVTREIYRETAFGRAFNGAVHAAISGLAGTGGSRTLRVLEIGAGSGSTTEAALAALAGHAVAYTVTDIAPTLVQRTADAMQGRAGLEFSVLDIERDPIEQGFPEGAYDLVIAANVLHATADLRQSTRHAARLLAPNGVLLLLEGTRPEPWVDVTFGLTEGWWRFRDEDVRREYPLVSVEQWTEVLRSTGYTEVSALPEDALAAAAGQVLLVARAARVAAPIALTLAASPALSEALRGQGAHVRMMDGANALAMVAGNVLLDLRRGAELQTVLDTLRAVAAATERTRLWIATEGAQGMSPTERPDPDGAIAWGLARCFGLEHADRWGGIIDVERGTSDANAAAQFLAELRAGTEEDQVAYRNGTRRVPRLIAVEAPPTASPIRDGTYLVTGGLGGLGLKVGKWLADQGATRVVLVGRTADPAAWAADDPRLEALSAIRSSGADVMVRTLDLTDRAAVAAVFADLRAEGPPLRGILHAAAVFDATPIAHMDAATLAAVLAPKAEGARHLLEVGDAASLDFVVLFSSTTSLLGVSGLGAYAAANQYLDAIAQRARADGLPVTAVQWGLWEEMRLADAGDAARYAQSGLRRMRNDAALDALARVIAVGQPNVVVADIDWATLRAVYEARRRRPLLSELGTAVAAPVADAPSQRSELDALATLPAAERRERILAAIDDAVRSVLRLPTARKVDRDQGFFEMGMDSLMSVELKGRLERRFAAKLPATLTFNYPSILAVGEFLDDRLFANAGAAPSEPNAVIVPPEAVTPGSDPIDADEMSEEALTELLGQRLRRLETGSPA